MTYPVWLSTPPFHITLVISLAGFAYKTCGDNGTWEGRTPGDYSRPQGWTNYTDCYFQEYEDLFNDMFKPSNESVLSAEASPVNTSYTNPGSNVLGELSRAADHQAEVLDQLAKELTQQADFLAELSNEAVHQAALLDELSKQQV